MTTKQSEVLGTCENYEDPRCAATHHHEPARCINWKPVALRGTCSRDTTPHPECLQGDWKPITVPHDDPYIHAAQAEGERLSGSEVLGTCSGEFCPREPHLFVAGSACIKWKPLGTCADRPTKPHIEGSHSACDMFTPVAAPEKREDGWISVEQELPPAKGKYLVYRINHSGLPIMVAHYNPAARMHGHWHSAHNGKPFVITHWRPLPAPPEASK